jgi:NAD dependent epimerase/dehydratase family
VPDSRRHGQEQGPATLLSLTAVASTRPDSSCRGRCAERSFLSNEGCLRLVHEFHRATGVWCVIGRLLNVYGPRETNGLIPEILCQLFEVRQPIELGNLSARRDYIQRSSSHR